MLHTAGDPTGVDLCSIIAQNPVRPIESLH